MRRKLTVSNFCCQTNNKVHTKFHKNLSLSLSCRTTYIYMSYRTANLQKLHYIYYSTNIRTEYFKHAAHSPFFSSKCRLFHNATFFGSCVIHILYTECAKVKIKIRRQRVNSSCLRTDTTLNHPLTKGCASTG